MVLLKLTVDRTRPLNTSRAALVVACLPGPRDRVSAYGMRRMKWRRLPRPWVFERQLDPGLLHHVRGPHLTASPMGDISLISISIEATTAFNVAPTLVALRAMSRASFDPTSFSPARSYSISPFAGRPWAWAWIPIDVSPARKPKGRPVPCDHELLVHGDHVTGSGLR